jgi:hypothetical protein
MGRCMSNSGSPEVCRGTTLRFYKSNYYSPVVYQFRQSEDSKVPERRSFKSKADKQAAYPQVESSQSQKPGGGKLPVLHSLPSRGQSPGPCNDNDPRRVQLHFRVAVRHWPKKDSGVLRSSERGESRRQAVKRKASDQTQPPHSYTWASREPPRYWLGRESSF